MALTREPEPHPGVQAAARHAAGIEGMSQSDPWVSLPGKIPDALTAPPPTGSLSARANPILPLAPPEAAAAAGLSVRLPIRSVCFRLCPPAALPLWLPPPLCRPGRTAGVPPPSGNGPPWSATAPAPSAAPLPLPAPLAAPAPIPLVTAPVAAAPAPVVAAPRPWLLRPSGSAT